MINWITDYLGSCDDYQYNKSYCHTKFRLLQPWETPYAPWVSVSTNFIVQLQESKGHTQICMVVERFTKLTHLIGLKKRDSVSEVAKVFLESVWKFQGIPKEIGSDWDTKVTGE